MAQVCNKSSINSALLSYFRLFISWFRCSSSVGRQGGKQVIHLAGGCKRIGTVVHEMMHTMGIIHEQSRPDRDDHVLVQFNHIKKGEYIYT